MVTGSARPITPAQHTFVIYLCIISINIIVYIYPNLCDTEAENERNISYGKYMINLLVAHDIVYVYIRDNI